MTYGPDGDYVACVNTDSDRNVRIFQVNNGNEIVYDDNAVAAVFNHI